MSDRRSYHRRASSPFLSDISAIAQEENRASGATRSDEDVPDFLTSLGLSSYIPVFEENQIAMSDIPMLSKEDLIDMGIPIGPRNRILRSIRDSSHPQRPKESSREALRKEIEDFMKEVDELTAGTSLNHIANFTDTVFKMSENQSALMSSIQENSERIRELSSEFSTPSPHKHPRKCKASPLHRF